jgi:pimeloyl-ACP methyl ester carboxylesterase
MARSGGPGGGGAPPGRRLAAAMPWARFELVRHGYTFVSEDQPEEISRLILEFLTETTVPGSVAADAGGM